MNTQQETIGFWPCGCDQTSGSHIKSTSLAFCPGCNKRRDDLKETVVPSGMGGVFVVDILAVKEGRATVKVAKNSNGFDALPPFSVPLQDISPRWMQKTSRTPQGIEDIKNAVDAGCAVHWRNLGYLATKDSLGQYLITFERNGSTIGLTDRSGSQLNGQLDDFLIFEL